MIFLNSEKRAVLGEVHANIVFYHINQGLIILQQWFPIFVVHNKPEENKEYFYKNTVQLPWIIQGRNCEIMSRKFEKLIASSATSATVK